MKNDATVGAWVSDRGVDLTLFYKSGEGVAWRSQAGRQSCDGANLTSFLGAAADPAVGYVRAIETNIAAYSSWIQLSKQLFHSEWHFRSLQCG